MKHEIYLDGKLKAELPGNLNNDAWIPILKIYLFNEEYNSWKEFKIKEVDE